MNTTSNNKSGLIVDALFPSTSGALRSAQASTRSAPLFFLLGLLFTLIKRILVAVTTTVISLILYPTKYAITYLWSRYKEKNKLATYRFTWQSLLNIGINFFLIIVNKKVRDLAIKENISYKYMSKEEYDKQMAEMNSVFHTIADPIINAEVTEELKPKLDKVLPLVQNLSAVVQNTKNKPCLAENAIASVKEAMEEFRQDIIDAVGEETYNKLREGLN
jgi:hypothetical protein